MAVLQTLRTKAAGLLIGILGLALLAFILSDLFSSGNAWYNKFKDKAFSVDGEVVPTKKYADRIEEWETFEKLRRNVTSLDEPIQAQIRESVYQQMVKEMMLADQAEKLGLSVSQEEMDDMAYGTNISPVLYSVGFFTDPQTGQFDKNALTQFLTQVKQDISSVQDVQVQSQLIELKKVWAFIENMMKYQRLEEKYNALLAKTILVNNSEVKQSFEDTKNVADFAYVVQRYNTIPDSTIQVSESEVKALYEIRKNNYKLDTDLRKISYFIRDVIPSEEDYDAVAKEMDAAKNKLLTTNNPALVVNEYSSSQFIDAFVAVSALPQDAKKFAETASINEIYGPIRDDQSYVMYKLLDKTIAPDSIKLQVLPLPQNLDATITNQIADSLLNVIKAGKDFATVAQERAPGSNAGEAVWVNEMMLANTFGIGKQCFAANKGDILKLSLNGNLSLVRIDDKTKPVAKVKIASIYMPVLVSDKTQNTIDNELNQFLTESGKPDKIEADAQNKGYNLISDAMIYPSEPNLQQTPGSRQVIHWAFNEKVGSIKKFDLSDKRIIAVIKQDIPSGYMPESEVSATLKAELIKDKKAAKMIEDLKSKNLTSLDAYAQQIGTRVDSVHFVTFDSNNISGIGFEPVFNVYSKVGQQNKLDGPLKGENGVYVLDAINKTVDTKEMNAAEIKSKLSQTTTYMMMQSLSALTEKMKVEDNRVKFW